MSGGNGKRGLHAKGCLYVLSAPSGTGKTTLCKRLVRAMPGLVRSVSVTTRQPRHGEREGKDYFFISQNAFQRLRRKGGLLEWTEYAHSFYGTPLAPLTQALRKGKDVILLLDSRGARGIKKRFRNAKTVFLLPPTWGDLKKRLMGRRTEKKADLARRLRIAEQEMAYADRYDYVIVNDDLSRALRALRRIVKRER